MSIPDIVGLLSYLLYCRPPGRALGRSANLVIVVEFNLRLPSMLHGKKGFERLVWAAKNVLNQSLVWLFLDLNDDVKGINTDTVRFDDFMGIPNQAVRPLNGIRGTDSRTSSNPPQHYPFDPDALKCACAPITDDSSRLPSPNYSFRRNPRVGPRSSGIP